MVFGTSVEEEVVVVTWVAFCCCWLVGVSIWINSIASSGGFSFWVRITISWLGSFSFFDQVLELSEIETLAPLVAAPVVDDADLEVLCRKWRSLFGNSSSAPAASVRPRRDKTSISSWSSNSLLNFKWYSDWSSLIEQSISVSRDVETHMNGSVTDDLKYKVFHNYVRLRIYFYYRNAFRCTYWLTATFLFLWISLLKATCCNNKSCKIFSFWRIFRCNEFFSEWN